MNTQELIVGIIIVLAVTAAILLFRKHWRKPEQCSKYSGCKDCPLAQDCDKAKHG